MKIIDLEFSVKICIVILIAMLSMYMLNRVGGMSINDSNLQAEKVHGLVEKALMQSFALEGAYPSEGAFEQTMNKYGVFFDRDKFIFHYHAFSSNILPEFRVIAL